MKIKIPKSRVREIIKEELDLALGRLRIDEEVFSQTVRVGNYSLPSGSKYHGGSVSRRAQGPALGTEQEEISCDDAFKGSSSERYALSEKLQSKFDSIDKKIKKFAKEISEKADVSWVTYEEFLKEEDKPFGLINVVSSDKCPASLSFKMNISGVSGINMWEIYLELGKIVKEMDGISIRSPITASSASEMEGLEDGNKFVESSDDSPEDYLSVWESAVSGGGGSRTSSEEESETEEDPESNVGSVVGDG